jgi:uncharacterized protein DUF4410
MDRRRLVLGAMACAFLLGNARAQAPYGAVEVDRFPGAAGIDFPLDHQIALVEDIIREAGRAFHGIEIVREGESAPQGKPTLKIAGSVIKFKPGSRAKRYLIGFGAGATVIKAHVKLIDAASGEVRAEGDIQGVTWIGIAGGSSDKAGDRLAKKVTALAKSKRLL